MPKDLFFTLSQEKQSRIIEAAIGEFSKVTYHDVSINQIIKNAEISRGSFYQYFEDKDDLYFYILENIIQSVVNSGTIDNVKPMPHSIISVNRELLLFNLKLLADEHYKRLFKNLYLSMNQQLQQKFKNIINKTKMKVLKTKINISAADSESDSRYVKELMNILEMINRDLLTMKIVNNMDDNSILETYDFRIQVLCNLSKYRED